MSITYTFLINNIILIPKKLANSKSLKKMNSIILSESYSKQQNVLYPALKSRSIKTNQQQFDDSFLEQNDFEHPQTIKKAIIRFFQQCLDQKSCPNFFETQILEKNVKNQNEFLNKFHLNQQLQNCLLMTPIQKQQFCLDLKSQKYLKKLFEQLRHILNKKIYSQIFYIGMKVWEQFLQFQKGFLIQNPIVQKFRPRKQLLQQMIDQDFKIELNKISLKSLLEFGEKITFQMYTILLNDKKLKWITLKQVNLSISVLQMHSNFKKMIQVLIKGILLSIQQYFQHPDTEEGQFNKYFQLETNILQIQSNGDNNQLPAIFF